MIQNFTNEQLNYIYWTGRLHESVVRNANSNNILSVKDFEV